MAARICNEHAVLCYVLHPMEAIIQYSFSNATATRSRWQADMCELIALVLVKRALIVLDHTHKRGTQ
jgi:hypothetical protein